MRRAWILTLLLWLLPALAWGQGQLINGNRTIAGTFNAGLSTGTGTAYVLTLNPGITAYVPDQAFMFRAHTANTGPATLAVTAGSALAMKKWSSGALVALAAGDIQAQQEVEVAYDGTQFQVLSLGGGGGGTVLGPTGTLQASNGTGGLAAYAGDRCTTAGTMMVGTTSTGGAICDPVPAPVVSGRPLLVEPSTSFPTGVNLGAQASGLVRSTVSGGVASISTVPSPVGALVGTTDVQELDGKRVNARVVAVSDTATITVDLSAGDVVSLSELSQATTMANPTGTAKPGQLLRFLIHTTLPRALTWGTFWSNEVGFPLPTTTSGASLYDTFWFQYNAGSGKMDLIYNSQLAALTLPTGVVPGTYACPTSLTIDANQRISAVVAGTCSGGGGGGATAAGSTGDVQVKGASGLTADTGVFTHDVLAHVTRMQQMIVGTGVGALALADSHGFKHTLRAPTLTADRISYLPDRDGAVPLTTGGVAGHLAVFASDGVGLVDGGAPGAGGGGDASTNTATSIDSEVALFSGTGGKTLKRATGTGIAKLTSGVQSTVAAPTGGIVGDTDTQTISNKRITRRVTTLSSSSTYTCPGDTSDQCKMSYTGGAGTLTVAAPTGTPVDGDMLMLRFLCSNLQALSWNSSFQASPNVPLPGSCPADTTKETVVGVMWSSGLSKWLVLASN